MKRLLTLFVISFAFLTAVSAGELDSLYSRLDNMLSIQQKLIYQKKKYLAKVTALLRQKRLKDIERYEIYSRLYDEYASFKFDSAYKYVELNIALAHQLKDGRRYSESLMKKAHILSVAGLFVDAFGIYKSIDVNSLPQNDKISYYNSMYDLYLYKTFYDIGTPYGKEYRRKADLYRELTLKYAGKETSGWKYVKSRELAAHRNIDGAINLIRSIQYQYRSGSRDYSIATAMMAFYYEQKKDISSQKKYLLLSAISDLEGCITENNSIRELSAVLSKEGDMKRAYKYLMASIADAKFYNTKLRNIQTADLVPHTINAFQNEKTRLGNTLNAMGGICAVLFILLIVCTIYLRRMKRKSAAIIDEKSRLSEQVKEATGKLRNIRDIESRYSESNRIKEQYIARLLSTVASIIHRTIDFNKVLFRHIKGEDFQEIYRKLRSMEFEEDMMEYMYRNFDTAFLNTYPRFVEELNLLMKPDMPYHIKENGRLNTELRILALIRLGITDNDKIAKILHSQITTIYTYRSKIKNKANNHEEIENMVMKIS